MRNQDPFRQRKPSPMSRRWLLNPLQPSKPTVRLRKSQKRNLRALRFVVNRRRSKHEAMLRRAGKLARKTMGPLIPIWTHYRIDQPIQCGPETELVTLLQGDGTMDVLVMEHDRLVSKRVVYPIFSRPL
jgi:hypothetical protein